MSCVDVIPYELSSTVLLLLYMRCALFISPAFRAGGEFLKLDLLFDILSVYYKQYLIFLSFEARDI